MKDGAAVEQGSVAQVFEAPQHPFYIATLFVPQHRSTADEPHPLVTGLLAAAHERALRAIDAGDAAAVLDRWVSVTRSLAGRD